MRTPSRFKVTVIGLVIAMGATAAIAWVLAGADGGSTPTELSMIRQHMGAAVQADSVVPTNLIADFFQSKYPPAQRAEFHVSSRRSISVFVLATGVEVRTDSGWQPFSEEPRNEIWRLKPGSAQDVFVQIPQTETEQIWRAYVCYATEMHGPSLFKAQIREAWKIRSLTNWTGRAWGGGRFSGRYQLLSEEYPE